MAKASKLVKRLMRGLQADGSAVETGPTLGEFLRATADTSVGRGRRKLPSRIGLRSREGGDTLVILDGKTRKSTGVALVPGLNATVARLAALDALERYNEGRTGELLRELSHEDVTIAEVLEEWLEDRKAIEAGPLFRQHCRFAKQLLVHFTETRLGDLRYSAGLDYLKERTGDDSKDKVSRLYAVDHLKMLRRAIEYFCRKHMLDIVYHFEIPKATSTKTPKWLTWDQLIRLLLASRGWQWDVARDRWKTKTVTGADGREIIVLDILEGPELDEIRMIERYILIYVYSGTRHSAILSLRWGANLEGGSIDTAAGVIYRAGIGKNATRKRKEPSLLLGSLKRMVSRWESKDHKMSCEHVIHDAVGNPVDKIVAQFDKVKRNAGLEWVTPHVLKHTGATLLTHAGLDINVLARSFSTTADTLMKAYTHLHWKWLDAKASKFTDADLDLQSLKRTSPRSISAWRKTAAVRAEG